MLVLLIWLVVQEIGEFGVGVSRYIDYVSGEHSYELYVRKVDGVKEWYGPVIARGGVVFGLRVLGGNAVSGDVVVGYGVPVDGDVEVVVYDVGGRVVDRLVGGECERGLYRVVWDASALPCGVYFVRLSVGVR